MGAGDTGNTQQGQQDSGGGFESTNPFVEVQFTDTSSGADSVLWNFGDGNTSTERNPKHKFYENGNYNVTLTVTNSAGEAISQESVQVNGIGQDSVSSTEEDPPIDEQGTEEEKEIIYGCTDPTAINYDSNATQDNGSCQYEPEEDSVYIEPKPTNPPTGYNPAMNILQIGTMSSKKMWEWTGFGWVFGYLHPDYTSNTDTSGDDTSGDDTSGDDSDTTGNTSPKYSYNLEGQLNNRQYNSINNTTSLFIVLNSVNSPGLISQIQNYVNVSNAIRINGSFSTITNFEYNSSDNSGRITIQGNMGNSSASDVNPTTAYNFEMIIESDTELDTNTSGNTSGDTGGDTGGDDGIRGCTDPQADNFNRFATIDDGSCEYSSGY